MFINMNEGKRGRGEATSFYYYPRIVVSRIHPSINTSISCCTPTTKRKSEASMELTVESEKVVSEFMDTTDDSRGQGNPMCLEHLPSLVFCHLMHFLPHSAHLNLSMTSSCLHSLVMREWKGNPSLWRHITISPTLSPTGLASLKKAILGKRRFIRSIRLDMIDQHRSQVVNFESRIADGNDFLSDSVCDFICGFYRLRRIVVQPKIKHRHIIRSFFSKVIFIHPCVLQLPGSCLPSPVSSLWS